MFLQVFLLTVVFGLFHGVVFFPVILSLVGPKEVLLASTSTSVTSVETLKGHRNPTFVLEGPGSAADVSILNILKSRYFIAKGEGYSIIIFDHSSSCMPKMKISIEKLN